MKDLKAKVKENTEIAENIYKMTLILPENPGNIRGGQFLNLSVGDDSLLLRRPFGICISEGNEITVCYQLKGEGTKKLTAVKAGDSLKVLLPLGNGFDVSAYKKVAVIGGGVGIFPLISVIRENYKRVDFSAFIGFRNKRAVCLLPEFEKCSSLAVTTDDGSYGKRGNAVQAFIEDCEKADCEAIIACGPPVMLRALKQKLRDGNIKIPCFVSLEERMGCGIGACLVCVCKTEVGKNKRVCKDGPVFNIDEIEI